MSDPCVVENGLVFHLPCACEVRIFLISNAALHALGARQGYVMDEINLYRAHEAIIHRVARCLALDDRSDLPILIETQHFQGFRASARSLSQVGLLQPDLA